MAGEKIRLAMVGTGGISTAHAQGVLAYPDLVEVTALCDVSPENLQARSEQLGGVAAKYTDWNEMLAEYGEQIDAVDIMLPHHLHAPAIMAAAQAGKHILCEKPMCMSMEEADAIEAAVAAAGVTYMSAHNQLFMPAVQEAKRRLDDGELGRVLWLRSQDCFRANIETFAGKWRAELKYQGGGELIDTGYHPTYRLLYLAGDCPVVGVRSSMGRFLQQIEGEDTASVQVRFGSGALGEILTSWAFANPFGSYQIHVIGEKGQLFGSGNTLNVLPLGASEPEAITLPQANTFAEQMKHFAECLLNGTRPLHSVAEGRAVLAIIKLAMEDARGWERLLAARM